MKFLISTVVTFFASTILNSVYYALTASFNHLEGITRAKPLFPLLLINHVIFALIVCFLYPRTRFALSLPLRGVVFGVLSAALMFLPVAFVIRGTWYVPADWTFLVNSLFHLASGAVMGWLIALIYGNTVT